MLLREQSRLLQASSTMCPWSSFSPSLSCLRRQQYTKINTMNNRYILVICAQEILTKFCVECSSRQRTKTLALYQYLCEKKKVNCWQRFWHFDENARLLCSVSKSISQTKLWHMRRISLRPQISYHLRFSNFYFIFRSKKNFLEFIFFVEKSLWMEFFLFFLAPRGPESDWIFAIFVLISSSLSTYKHVKHLDSILNKNYIHEWQGCQTSDTFKQTLKSRLRLICFSKGFALLLTGLQVST